MSTAELTSPTPTAPPPLKLCAPTKSRPRWIEEQWWRRVNVLVPHPGNPSVLWQPPQIEKPGKRQAWHAVPKRYADSTCPCRTCQRPFQSVEELYDHLLSGCWSYGDVRAIPRTSVDISAEMDICRSWTKAIHHSDDNARNVVLVSLAPLFRSQRICGQDRTGDRMSITLHAAAVELEKASHDPNHPLRNGSTFFPDARRRLTSDSLRELKEAAKAEPKESISSSAVPVKTSFEWLANEAKKAIWHAKNGQREVIDGTTHWHGGDRNHGVTAVPTKMKAGKARGRCRRLPEVMRASENEYTRHNRPLSESDAGVHFLETSQWRTINGRWCEEITRTRRFDVDAGVKFDTEHNRFSRTWDLPTVVFAALEGILNYDGSLRIDGWINDHVADEEDRKILLLRADRLTQEKISKCIGAKRRTVADKLAELKLHCRKKLKVPLPGTQAEKPEYQPPPEATISEMAAIIEARRLEELKRLRQQQGAQFPSVDRSDNFCRQTVYCTPNDELQAAWPLEHWRRADSMFLKLPDPRCTTAHPESVVRFAD